MTRQLLDGRVVDELSASVPIKIETRCPKKWLFVDTETGDVWRCEDTDQGGFKGVPNAAEILDPIVQRYRTTMSCNEIVRTKNPKAFTDEQIKTLWPSARGELIAFGVSMVNRGIGITGTQVLMAVHICDLYFELLDKFPNAA